MRGIHLAQVIAVHPSAPDPTPEDQPPYAGTLDVILLDATPVDDPQRAYRVRVLRPRAHPSAGHYLMPEVGDFGLVAFYANDPRAGVWLGALDDNLRQMVPEELWARDPYAEVHHLPSDRYAIYHGDGTEEHVWPDGTFLKLTTRKDGSFSNAGYRAKLTERKARRKTRAFASQRVPYTPHQEPPLDLVFRHASGAEVWLSADGSLEVRTAEGHAVRLFDGTEKARDPATGAPLGGGEQPRYVEVRTAGGHAVRLEDRPNPALRLTTAHGHRVALDDQAGLVEVVHAGGHVLRMGPGSVELAAQGNLRLTATGEVVIDGAVIRVG